MRARMALAYTGILCEHREITLRNKPAEMLNASPKSTVPVLVLPDGAVVDESLAIMFWALTQSDPDGWRNPPVSRSEQAWLQDNDGPFKTLLDKYKYADRYPEQVAEFYRDQALPYLVAIDNALSTAAWLHGDHIGLCDIALVPFVRQFAMVDMPWFSRCSLTALKAWLNTLLNSPLFITVMEKYEPWAPESAPIFSEIMQ